MTQSRQGITENEENLCIPADEESVLKMKVVKVICEQKVFEIVFKTIDHAETLDSKVI